MNDRFRNDSFALSPSAGLSSLLGHGPLHLVHSPRKFDVNFIHRMIYMSTSTASGFLNHNTIHTALQPIFSLAHKRIVGYEALVRGKNAAGQSIGPAELFSGQDEEAYQVLLDRLCRYVHIKNFLTLKDDTNWLFLNVSPVVIHKGKFYGSYFKDLLEKTGMPPHQVVIEIVEHPVSSRERLMETVNYYRDLGCLIAIDDFGASSSNFDRIWDLSPDIVKLDRSIIFQAAQEVKIRRLIPGIVSLLHQAGALVLVEGVETREQAIITMDTDTDFVQGYFFSKPTDRMDFTDLSAPDFESLFETYKDVSQAQATLTRSVYSGYQKMFAKATDGLRNGGPLEESCAGLLEHESIVRCFLLHPDGIQIGQTIVSGNCLHNQDLRFKPVQDASNADWFRRHYLRRAIVHPEQVQITRPYLSITGAHMCVTLSQLFSTPDGDRVLCCDLISE